MAVQGIETYFAFGYWCNRVDAGDALLKTRHPTKARAVRAARRKAAQLGLEHVVRSLDGSVSDRRTYK